MSLSVFHFLAGCQSPWEPCGGRGKQEVALSQGHDGGPLNTEETRPNPWQEITQPFVDFLKAPRALWAINLGYLLEGFAYFGVLTYLAMYFNDYVKLNDLHAGWMVGVLTSGITLAMLVLGSRVDVWGLRRTLFTAFGLLLSGRILLAVVPSLGLGTAPLVASLPLTSPMNLAAVGAILLVVSGFGMFQPAVYAGTRSVTTAATSGMAFAMLYAVNNLGGWLPSFMSPVRKAFGIQGALGFFAFVTLLALLLVVVLLNRRTLEAAQAAAKEAKAEEASAPAEAAETPAPKKGLGEWLRTHPLADARFTFFIFALIPVQTLFAYNWLVLPQYVARAYQGTWMGANFEAATNLNPLLIFILCPMVAALTARTKVYPMMIAGTAVMAAPAFILALGPSVPGLLAYLLVLSVGEAMWQPRFLQYAAEIAPEGRTGAYMGVAQLPWFLTKFLVPAYSGLALGHWCPKEGVQATGQMWLVFGLIACASPVLLLLAKGWVGKGMKA